MLLYNINIKNLFHNYSFIQRVGEVKFVHQHFIFGDNRSNISSDKFLLRHYTAKVVTSWVGFCVCMPFRKYCRRNKDTTWDSVISILLHFIMPLSIISTDYMQLDLLYSFLLSAWTDTRRFRLQIHRYMCVFLYSMKERAVTGITWLPGGGGSEGWAPLSV